MVTFDTWYILRFTENLRIYWQIQGTVKTSIISKGCDFKRYVVYFTHRLSSPCFIRLIPLYIESSKIKVMRIFRGFIGLAMITIHINNTKYSLYYVFSFYFWNITIYFVSTSLNIVYHQNLLFSSYSSQISDQSFDLNLYFLTDFSVFLPPFALP